MSFERVTVIGGGLSGSECACQLADRGVPVRLYEMRPDYSSPAHHTGSLAELVCSNSFKSTRVDSAAGLRLRSQHTFPRSDRSFAGWNIRDIGRERSLLRRLPRSSVGNFLMC